MLTVLNALPSAMIVFLMKSQVKLSAIKAEKDFNLIKIRVSACQSPVAKLGSTKWKNWRETKFWLIPLQTLMIIFARVWNIFDFYYILYRLQTGVCKLLEQLHLQHLPARLHLILSVKQQQDLSEVPRQLPDLRTG